MHLFTKISTVFVNNKQLTMNYGLLVSVEATLIPLSIPLLYYDVSFFMWDMHDENRLFIIICLYFLP